MSACGVAACITGLRSLSLAELDSIAALQTRTDRKYVVARHQLAAVLTAVADSARVLEIDGFRSFDYESVYFDTDRLDSYLGSARRRRHRFKVRTRSYLDTGTCSVEVKLRDNRGRTVKHRQPHSIADRDRLTADAIGFVEDFPALASIAPELRPTVRTFYRRTTLVVGDSRTTIDSDLTCMSLSPSTTAVVGLDDLLVVETKTTGRPCEVDRVLWSLQIRPTALSKYGTGLAALHPDLPSNKWHRTLDRHVHVRVASHPSVSNGRQLS